MPPPVLELISASVRFGTNVALEPIDVTVQTARTTVLLGPSGSGKTTALRLMLGLLRPDAGTVLFHQAQLSRERLPYVRSRMGYVIQDGGLFPHLTARGNVELAAIVVAIPLGILAASRPRFAQVLLAVVGVIQTIPTLALLVFMIPLFGIGGLPAVIALFLYSLLPIVRNTHAGLKSIPSSLRESAHALGLSPNARLRLVELPLASPLILAGIKSAAIINVGTATLGALVGAGGLGQPIFTGIRLDDWKLILQGAIPASLLALLVQAMFELAERWFVPKSLRSFAAQQ